MEHGFPSGHDILSMLRYAGNYADALRKLATGVAWDPQRAYVEYGEQVFAISDELLNLIVNTDPISDLGKDDLVPFGAFAIALPLGQTHLRAARGTDNTGAPLRLIVADFTTGGLAALGMPSDEPPDDPIIVATDGNTPQNFLGQVAQSYGKMMGAECSVEPRPDGLKSTSGQMLNFLLTIRQIMISEPELISGSTKPLRKLMKLGNGERVQVYEPRWIGQGIVVRPPSSSLGGTHASPSTHWRRGHWQRIPCGPGRTERKRAWIRPILVNAPETA